MERRHRRTLVEVLSTAVLVLGCTPSGYHPRPDSLTARNLTIQSARPVDRVARRQARVIAAKVAAGARHAEHVERGPDLVEDRVIVKTTADGRVMVEQLGEASWYGAWHRGRPTASGARFDEHALTAAHPTLPLGTRATVTNLATGASIDVVVNDRGPYVYGRDIDLSRAAAQAIGVIRAGSAAVRIEVVVDGGTVRRADRRSPGRRAAG
ncbi:MAG: septal ring lytic transglycosylase RlpA family protein [Candidatus Binatia bacterium]